MVFGLMKTIYITIWIISYILHLANCQNVSICQNMMDTSTHDYCCGNAILSKFIFMTSNCSIYWNDFTSCRHECLFNHWNLLDDENKIKKPELYTMITELYNPLNGYHSYGTAMKRAFESCDKLYARYADFVFLYSSEAQKKLKFSDKCEPFAMFYAQCVAAHMFLNCPIEYLASNTLCDEHRIALISCTKLLGLTSTMDDFDYSKEMKKNTAYRIRKTIKDFITLVILLGLHFCK